MTAGIEETYESVKESLVDIKYNISSENFENAVKGGSESVDYTQLVSWLSKELQYFLKLDDHINPIQNADDSESFLLEVCTFLKELGCQFKCLVGGSSKDKLKNKYEKLLLLEYLITELQAARMYAVNNPDEDTVQLTINESPTAAALKKMLISLNVPKPPSNIALTSDMLFSKLKKKVEESKDKLILEPLFQGVLTDKQWHILSDVQKEMDEEYKTRRQLLLKRLDVTVQSFQWSDKIKGKENNVTNKFDPLRKKMKANPTVDIADMLAARKNLAIIEKTSSASVRKKTQTNLNTIIIGKVPDRGGRPSEQQPPPPEMPSWAPRAPDSGRGGRGGGRGGGGGGRVQGGWNQGGGGGYQGAGGGGYQGAGGGGYQGGGGGGYQGAGGGGDQGGGGGGYQGGGGGGGYQGGGGGYQGGGGGYQGGGGGYQGGGGGYQGGGGYGGYQGDGGSNYRGGRRGRGRY